MRAIDLIRREDAIEALNSVNASHFRLKGTPIVGYATMMDELKNLPSVEHTGRWTYERHEDAPMLFKDRWICSACGVGNTHGKTHYCPWCGAKMELYEEAKE